MDTNTIYLVFLENTCLCCLLYFDRFSNYFYFSLKLACLEISIAKYENLVSFISWWMNTNYLSMEFKCLSIIFLMQIIMSAPVQIYGFFFFPEYSEVSNTYLLILLSNNLQLIFLQENWICYCLIFLPVWKMWFILASEQ